MQLRLIIANIILASFFIFSCHSYSIKTPVETEKRSLGIFEEDLAKDITQSSPLSPNIPLGLSAEFDIQYQGAFRALAKGESSSNSAVGTLAYNIDQNSIFLAGHSRENSIAEFEIPEKLSLDPKISNIPKAKVLQNYVNVLDKRKVGNKTNKITGMLYYKNSLLINSEIWYDAGGKNQDNLLLISDANNLKGSEYKGMLQLEGAAEAAGYMSQIPAELRELFGGRYLTGWASNFSITSRYSQGPSLYVFDPQSVIQADLTNDKTIPTEAKMVFPYKGNKSLVSGSHKYRDDVSPIWGALANARYGFIVPDSNVFMVVGYNGGIHGGIGYKIKQDNGRLCGGGCSREAKDHYNYYWLFDVNDIINADEPHKVKPFNYGKWSHPYDKAGGHKVIGGTYDAKNSRLLLTLSHAGRIGKYDRPPLILSYKIAVK